MSAEENHSVLDSQWFWTGVGIVVLAGAVAGIAAGASGGRNSDTNAELGTTSISGWPTF